MSVPNYVINALNRLQHTQQQPEYSPHAYRPIICDQAGQRQYTTSPDTSQLLPSKETTQVQSVLGTFLYYAKSISETMLTVVNDIGIQ